VFRPVFARMENALDGSRHLCGADLAQPQGFVQRSVVGQFELAQELGDGRAAHT